MTTLNVPEDFTIEKLRHLPLDGLKSAFEAHLKKTHNFYSFKDHIIYYEFGVMSCQDDFKYPSKEIQESYLKENIQGFEEFIVYEIKSLYPELENKYPRYYLKGKFNNEKLFYIYCIIRT